MIYSREGDSSLSNTNITNCISQQATAFRYDYMKSTTKVKFCNFENLEATQKAISNLQNTDGIIERCNYINNSQTDKNYGLVHEYNKRLDVLDSVFRDNLKNKNGAIFSTISGQIYIFNCSIDTYSQSKNGGTISTSEMPMKPFFNDLKFIGISPCEGSLLIAQNKDKKDSIYKNIKLLSLINFFYHNI
ncbi:hypothetical protein TVAG_119730 [Trichomonas vaginalis G3]|uniref:Uncharacterized protein n=1 Tax=Trichomonas vaginalis (strain ATCC PRA-98 / G3) TaxID=412133 RepID=A2D7B9_TRIV3|nr:hypothetical protein TVAGG3_0992590 [Trichomonas vaginalis G3]EAY23636.1 hypothetical protein TVAG_119730 [Trichomonas vaginalis G3]KAI5490128.1 hypothetical protein TVAGG3_0992590 [Trichomonas vaginalis G3]|eukprot:XP_001276884.1 hypothetical protein [Trichomonas vaginalis G3]